MSTRVETQFDELSQKVARLQATTSELRDEIALLKNNYNILVKELSERLEVVHKKFREA